MAVFEIEIGGKTFEVEAPDQATAMAAIQGAGQRQPQPKAPAETDPVRSEVRGEIDSLRAKGVPVDVGYGRQFVQGMTMGAADEILAGLSTPMEMIRRGTFDPRKGYEYAKAFEDLRLEDARKSGGLLGSAVEVAGGVGSGLGLARGAAAAIPEAATGVQGIVRALLSGGRAGQGALGRVGTAAGSGALYGGVQGFNEGSGLEDRVAGAAKGGAIGGVGGGILQGAGEVGKRTLGFVGAQVNPAGYAERQLARALSESGRTAQDVGAEVLASDAAGQPFTVADALGNPGQRMLSMVTRNPGAGRTQAVEFLDARQAGQGRRMANIIAEGLDAPQTAAQTQQGLTAARKAAADINYGAARGSAGVVDPTAAIASADDFLQAGVTRLMSPQSQIADDSVEALVRRARSYLTDGNSVLTDFDAALRAKRELDRMIARNPDVRELYPIRNSLDDALAATSQPYANARDTFHRQSQAIEAVDAGRAMAQRGRSEDVIRSFQGMTPEQQAAARAGYADPIIERMQGGAQGVNKAREFTSDAMRAELPVVAAPGRAPSMMDRIARENTMFETRAAAMGGSKTADNLADNAAAAVNPEIFGSLARGDIVGAVRNLVVRSGDNVGGNTPRVREELARLLLQNGRNPNLTDVLGRAVTNEDAARRIAQALMRGTFGGAAAGSGNYAGQRTK